MLKLRDRLYGEIELPEEAARLATSCGVLLRLREIRMANIPFASFPSFANVDRFEHSLGVAHLAWRWSQINGLAEDQALALTLAALYHDGATPAFGHLFEEYLFRFGWNHEDGLVNLLLGQPGLPGRAQAQVFLGEPCRLHEVLASSPLADLVTAHGVADIAAGLGPLGRLIKGDLDFDNIDNVIRAASAMGLVEPRGFCHPCAIADSLVLEDGEVRLRSDGASAVAAWSRVRYMLYDSILNNGFEFQAQTAFKWAIEEAATLNIALQDRETAWLLTDPELLFLHLRREPFACSLVDRVRRGRPPKLLFSAWAEDLSPLLGLGGAAAISGIRAHLEQATGMKVYVNYYLDKRRRAVRLPKSRELVLFPSDEENAQPSSRAGVVGIVGVSAAEFAAARGGAATARKDLGADVYARVLEEVLGTSLRTASLGWVGTSEPTQQLALFEMVR